MKLPRELEERILATPGVTVRHAGQPGNFRDVTKNLVEPSVLFAGGKLVATLAVATASEINGRDWRARSRRTGTAWRAVSRTLGPHLILLAQFAAAYHRGESLRVRLVRLGGRTLDRSNLPTATKAVEDAVAFMLGADDGDRRWCAEWDQEPGPVGVRVEIEVV